MSRPQANESCCYTLVFVPGILGECVAHIATPFSDSYDRLRARGHRVIVLKTRGRASSSENARLIAEHMDMLEPDLGRVILIAYSKGLPDSLEALVRDPGARWVQKVVAVVSVAGVAFGTPAADQLTGLYETFFAKLPWATCQPEDGGGPRSLTSAERLRFFANHRLPERIKYYSLAAIAELPNMNPLLLPFHAALNKYGPNDGQIVANSAIIPGSYLLGFLKGDHWAVALPFNRSSSIEALPLRAGNGFPREVLIDSVLGFVTSTIER